MMRRVSAHSLRALPKGLRTAARQQKELLTAASRALAASALPTQAGAQAPGKPAVVANSSAASSSPASCRQTSHVSTSSAFSAAAMAPPRNLLMRAGKVPNPFMTSQLSDFHVDFKLPLGMGACGAVYPGTHEASSREVAVKVMSPGLPRSAQSSSEEVAEAIDQERTAFQKVLDAGTAHPHVVNVMGCFELTGSEARQRGLEAEELASNEPVHYFVMERLRGESLADRIHEAGGMSEDRAREVARAVCQGLEFLHEHHVAHRDLCPRNILYARKDSPDSDCKIIDFSHAGVVPAHIPEGGSYFDRTLGTAGYVAPEVLAANSPYGTKCDVYSLGCTIHGMLTNGKLPRRHPRVGIMTVLPPNISQECRDFVNLTLEPADKRPNVSELLNHPWLN